MDLVEGYKLNPTGVIHYLSGGRQVYSTANFKFIKSRKNSTRYNIMHSEAC